MDEKPPVLQIRVGCTLSEAEQQLIRATLAHCRGNKTRAASLLGISLKTLYNRLHLYGETDEAED